MATSTPETMALQYRKPDGNLTDLKYAFYDCAASQTASTLVAAVTAKRIVVVALFAMAAGTATTLLVNSASTAKSCVVPNGANGGWTWPLVQGGPGYFQTTAGEALTVTTGSGSTTSIHVWYIEV